MKRIRIVKNWEWPDLIQQTPGNTGKWDDIQFTGEPIEECDYLIILNNLERDLELSCPPGNVWRIVQEPPVDFLKSWHVNPSYSAKTFTCDPERSGPHYIKSHPLVPWHVNRNYDYLSTCCVPEKSKTLSWITSTRNVLPGHKKRMHFLEYIKKRLPELDLLGGNIRHIMNREAKEKIEREQRELGFMEIEDKWQGLSPYKYALAIESHIGPDYWTEKIADCFLTWTVPIYYGCTNLEDYFPQDAFIRIDIEKSTEPVDVIIRRVIEEDNWQERLPALEKARSLLLNNYQLFPTLSHYIQSLPQERISGKNKKHGKIHLKPVTKKTKPKISLVVCTYNREQLLPGCLESMARQQVDNDCYEVLVVDNNSKDNTQDVAGEFTKKYPNFRYAFEPQQGLSHARNLGIKEAKADYIAYIDDDARIGEDWIKIALKIIEEKQPHIFGGPAYPLFPDGKPEWFKEEYGIRGDMGETGWLHKGFIIGTNIVFKKSLLQEYGGFDPELGMKGDQLAYGEETTLVFRALKEGKKVYYSKEMAVKDQLPDYKKSLAFFLYFWYSVGKDLRTIANKTYPPSELPNLLKMIDSTFKQLDIALHKNKRDFRLFPYPENYIIENLKDNFVQIGQRMGYFLKPGNLDQQKLIEIFSNSHQSQEVQGKIVLKQGLFKTAKKKMSALFKHLENKRSKSPGKDKLPYNYKPDRIPEQLKENEDLILELGAGEVKRGNGWITLDNNPSCEIVHDLRKPLPFPPNTFKTVYSSHVLEHFYHHELILLLKEVYRILKVGGIFSICVPDASIYISAYSNPGNFDANYYCRYKPAVHIYSKIDYINYMAYMNGHHKMMFDEENLPRILEEVGFTGVRKRDFDPELDLKKRDYESLYFIANK